MGDTINSIATTHGQYYQLGLEQDRDINNISDGKNDIVVWYCLLGGVYGNSPNDVRNNYYLYSKGNVIYTGAGHSTINDDEEIKLFINAIVAAANVTAVQPQVNFVSALISLPGRQQGQMEIHWKGICSFILMSVITIW